MTIGNYAPSVSYKKGCRCDECVTHQRRYDKGRRLSTARGHKRLIPPDTARAHVDMLVAHGVSRRSIAQAMGYKDHTSLNTILNRDTIRASTQAKILAIKPDTIQTGRGWIDATGSTRRMQALAYMGWKLKDIAELTCMNMDTASNVRNGKIKNVTERVHRSIRLVYEEYGMSNGGDIRSTLKAQRSGWRSPLAWDDIDDPKEKPKR